MRMDGAGFGRPLVGVANNESRIHHFHRMAHVPQNPADADINVIHHTGLTLVYATIYDSN